MKNRAEYDRWEETQLRKVGWIAHCVFPRVDAPNENDNYPSGVNYHTHGLLGSFNHPDIQICFPASMESLHGIANAVIHEIKKGKKFEAGVKYYDIMQPPYAVEFIKARECGRDVLRLLIPDKNGEYKQHPYDKQLTLLDDGEE
jgi:hypothetical protein